MPQATQIASGILSKLSESEIEAVLKEAKEKAKAKKIEKVADAKTFLHLLDTACESFEITTPEINARISILEGKSGHPYIRVEPLEGQRMTAYTLFVLKGMGFQTVGHGGEWRLTATCAGFGYAVARATAQEPTNEPEPIKEPEPEQAVMQKKVRNSRKAAK